MTKGRNHRDERFRAYCLRLRPILESAVGQALQGLFQELPSRSAALLKDTFQGGKMLRGSLVCLISESLGGSLEAALPRSVAVELIHGATLIHDDFVDQDRTRRNKPAAWTLEGARKAVLMGDVIFASAIEMMSELGREDGLSVSRAIARLAKGAFQEPINPLDLAGHLETNALPGRLYDVIIDLKTGVLFGTACELGAIAAGQDDAVRNVCYRYGRLIGEAYQMADDLMEIRRHLATGVIGAREITVLAPALMSFGKDLQAQVVPLLSQERALLQGPLARGFEAVRKGMEREKERRVGLARLEASTLMADSPWDEMIDQTPREVVEMLGQS